MMVIVSHMDLIVHHCLVMLYCFVQSINAIKQQHDIPENNRAGSRMRAKTQKLVFYVVSPLIFIAGISAQNNRNFVPRVLPCKIADTQCRRLV